MTLDQIQNFLINLGFSIENGETKLIYVKNYTNNKISITIDRDLPMSNKTKINYGDVVVHRKTTSTFSQEENLVVLECVNRLLEKGYLPEHIELEKAYKAGHNSCYLDILVKDNSNKSFLMIECKTFGEQYNKEKSNVFKDGGQLLSYYQQDKNVKALCLYASKFENNKQSYIGEIILTKHLKGKNVQEIFDSWNKSFVKKGIFEQDVSSYSLNSAGLTYNDLQELTEEDGGIIFNQFAEILRRHIVSDKTNAFNKIFNLFICKIQDEDDKYYDAESDLNFQFKETDTNESLFDRLNTLYKKGNKNYIKVDLPDINEDKFSELLKLANNDESLKDIFKELRYYRSSQEFSFKEVYNKETFEENAEIVKEVVKLLENFKIRYSKKHQYLGDFFENLLNTGIKQESGQFFTPIPLARFICKSLPIGNIIEKKNNVGEKNFLPYVIDYACGSGHFLTEIMDEIDSHIQTIEIKDIKGGREAVKLFKSIKDDFSWAGTYVYGIEKDYRLVKTSKVSSFLNGDGDANIISGDGLAPFTSNKYEGVLKTEELQQDNPVFDMIVANPPYSVDGFRNTLENGDDCFELYSSLTDKSSEIECLFIERTKQLLKEGGVAGIILPISFLTNSGIYEKAREVLFKNFNIKAIVSLGNKAFMKTGTKTIILFLQKQNKIIFSQIEKHVNKFFETFKAITINGIENALSVYINNVYEGVTIDDYTNFLDNDEISEKLKESDFYGEYKDISKENIIETEKSKIIYFMLTYNQEIVVAESKEKDVEKEFYGYEFSERRGNEGIKIYKDEKGVTNTKLYNPDELLDDTKLNYYILNNFSDNSIKGKIEEIQQSDEHPLKDHIRFTRLSNLMDFENNKFENKINPSKKKLQIESKYPQLKLKKVLSTLESGKRPKGGVGRYKDGIPSLGGEHIRLDGKLNLQDLSFVPKTYYNQAIQGKLNDADILICKDGALTGKVALFNLNEFNYSEGMVNEHVFILRVNKDVLQKYLFHCLFSEIGQELLKNNITGSAQGGLNRENLYKIKIPVPPIPVQESMVKEIEELEEKVRATKKKIENSKSLIEETISKVYSQVSNYKKLVDITQDNTVKSGGTPKTKIAEYWNGNINWVTLEDAKSKYITSTKKKITDKGINKSGAVLLPVNTVMFSSRATIGRVCIAKEETATNQGFKNFICNTDEIHYEFLFYILREEGQKIKTQFDKTKYAEINATELGNHKIPVPDLPEQNKIVNIILKQEDKIKSLEQELLLLEKQKKDIIHKYLN